jgi:RNA polymerase sigma factor (sigma-70 family)
MTPNLEALVSESDAELAGRFAREVRPLIDNLLYYAWHLTRNHADAEELLQDTLLHAYSGFRHFEPGSNFKAWISRILHNCWCNAHRRRQRRPVEVLTDHKDWEPTHGTGDAPEASGSAESEALAALGHGDVLAAMDTLPVGVREAVYYTLVAGYSYRETAAILDLPSGTVMSRVSRGRKRLRVALSHVAPNRRDSTTAGTSAVAECITTGPDARLGPMQTKSANPPDPQYV